MSVPAGPHLRIERLTKRFGSFAAVDEVSLAIERGEIFCLLGGSGSGKTTLLRLLAGLETQDSGRVLIDGEDMSGVPSFRRPVNMMFQSYALFPHMTVEKNVAFGLEQERLPRRQIESRSREMLEMVQMAPYARRKPHQLSGGQRQRVALARALVKRPKLLLLDEPLAALDRKLREYTQFELLGIQQRLGVTFIVVTHDQQEAMTLASRMGVMDRGRIVQVGTAAEIYERPATRFVADFIGAANLLDCEVIGAGPQAVRLGCTALGIELQALHSRERPAPAYAAGTRIWAALRPERIEISLQREERPAADGVPAAGAAAAAAAAENEVTGTVQEIGYRGETSTYLVRTASGRVLRVTRPSAARRIARGDAVRLRWLPSSPILLTE
ncbi:MAG: ABC transporter ATP-binding protein [Steroidobacteraceae bacterium]